MKDIFQVAAGSVAGTDHTKPEFPGEKNNQDAGFIEQTDDVTVAFVCDGCGSSVASEVGAQIGAAVFTNALLKQATRYCHWVRENEATRSKDPFPTVYFERARTIALGHIAALADSMPGSFNNNIRKYFLFTMVGTLITPWRTYAFAVGDGVIVVNGEVTILGPFKGNKPPYIAYSLIESEFTADDLKIKIFADIPTNDVSSLLIGSDGVGDLIDAEGKMIPGTQDEVGHISQLWTNDEFFTDEFALQCWLDGLQRHKVRLEPDQVGIVRKLLSPDAPPPKKLVRHRGLLRDDTTLYVLRRTTTPLL